MAPQSAVTAGEPAPVTTPETLETPYIETPPPARTAPPTRANVGVGSVPRALPDTRPLAPIRDRRKLALLGEIGWNGLAGFGMILSYHAHPHVSLDLGGGFSLLGWKAGVRTRYNLLKTPMTPFLGVGFNATSGLGEVTSDPSKDSSADPGSQPFTLNVKASYLVQAVLGFDFIHKRGFNMQGALGYSWLLNKNNVELVDGSLTRDEKRAIDIVFKSGLVISLAWGYAFE
jgi:hypothetical protein